jgi:hypothetical protein
MTNIRDFPEHEKAGRQNHRAIASGKANAYYGLILLTLNPSPWERVRERLQKKAIK